MLKKNTDWLLFLSLEKDFIQTIDFVSLNPKNNGTESIIFLKLLISICSSIEKLAKKYCIELDKDFNKHSAGIKEINSTIISKIPYFSEVECLIPKYDLKFKPWENWGRNLTPNWWLGYNNVKHNNSDLEDATQKNVLEALSALFCLNLYYYHNELYDGSLEPLPQLLDYEKMPGHFIVNPGAELPGIPRNCT